MGTKILGCILEMVQGKAGEHQSKGCLGFSRIYHDYFGFDALGSDIVQAMDTKWKVKAELVELEEWGSDKCDVAWVTRSIPRGLNIVVTQGS